MKDAATKHISHITLFISASTTEGLKFISLRPQHNNKRVNNLRRAETRSYNIITIDKNKVKHYVNIPGQYEKTTSQQGKVLCLFSVVIKKYVS